MDRIKRFFTMSLAGLGLATSLALAPAPVAAAEYPMVASLTPFSAEANYMSLPGYLRFLVYQRDGIWLSRQESVAIVDRQIATGE
jgi:hypothetical protein